MTSSNVSSQDVSSMEADDVDLGTKRPRSTDDAQEEFIFPSRKLRARPTELKTPPTPVSNKFQNLNPDQPARDRPPRPIIISPPKSQVDLRKLLKDNGFTKFSMNSSPKETRLFMATEHDALNVRNLLRMDDDTHFHTFAPRGTRRTKRYVLHGFDFDHPISEVTEELQVTLPGFIRASKLNRSDEHTGRKTPTAAILIVTSPDVTLEHVTNLGYLNEVRFSANVFRPAPGPPQCYNCAGFGHTSRYCDHVCACSWCGGTHHLHECPLVAKPTKPKCVNCQGEHAATFKNCPKRLELLQRSLAARQRAAAPAPTAPPPTRGPSIPINPNLPFSQLFSGIPPIDPKTTSQLTPSANDDSGMPPWALRLFDMLTALMNMFMTMRNINTAPNSD